jgi:hypothetical protein
MRCAPWALRRAAENVCARYRLRLKAQLPGSQNASALPSLMGAGAFASDRRVPSAGRAPGGEASANPGSW